MGKKKDHKITKTMFIICSVFIISCTLRISARSLCYIHDKEENHEQNWCGNTWFIQFNSPFIKLCYIVYFSQFVTNIFIYVLQRDQYWKAIKDLLSKVTERVPRFGQST